ncbi:hypothetical protein Tco_1311107 [Tanacetum coccineum]
MEQPQSFVAQQITPANQLVHSSKFQTVRRCNNMVVLPNIPCPNECRIVGQLLVDHALSYALTATVDVPAVYIHQFWKTVRQVPNANETIRFIVNNHEITYTVDMFHATLKLLVKTLEQPFIPPIDLDYIQPFLRIFGYQGSLDKVSAFDVSSCSVLRSSGYGVLSLNSLWYLVKGRHGYAVSSLMDMTY